MSAVNFSSRFSVFDIIQLRTLLNTVKFIVVYCLLFIATKEVSNHFGFDFIMK